MKGLYHLEANFQTKKNEIARKYKKYSYFRYTKKRRGIKRMGIQLALSV